MRNVTFIVLSLLTTLAIPAAYYVWQTQTPLSWEWLISDYVGFTLIFLGWLLFSTFIVWRYLTSHSDVKFSSTYFRSLTATVIAFLLVIIGRGSHTTFTGYYGEQLALLGWVGLVMSFLIGTFSALSKKVWSWLRVSLLTFLGWLTALIVQGYIEQVYTR